MRISILLRNLNCGVCVNTKMTGQIGLFLLVIFSLSSCKKSAKSADEIVLQDSTESKISNKNFEDPNSHFKQRGLEYALTTQAVLGKNLMQSVKKSGTIGAISFCNEQAYPLTDSMAIVHNAFLKRVTDKPRNPKNQANTQELQYISKFKQDVTNQEPPKPIVTEGNGKVSVYYPILTNSLCLQCHGKPGENLKSPTLAKLKSLYPSDQAIGYDVNEVRGMWSVTFDK